MVFKQAAVLFLLPFFTVIEGGPVNSTDACKENSCGINAECRLLNNQSICYCPDDLYIGDPLIECKKVECSHSSHCSSNESCINNKCADVCLDPRLDFCGKDASCTTINHVPMCYCAAGYTGDPFLACLKLEPPFFFDPCNPSPCGPYSVCKKTENITAICSCLITYIGTPPNCHPHQCQGNQDCPDYKACSSSFRCENPCKCGENAICGVTNHQATCKCPPNWLGDPYISCRNFISENMDLSTNKTERQVENSTAVSGEFDCLEDDDCISKKACRNNNCVDPCIGSCAENAACKTKDHLPICYCSQGFGGNPFTKCEEKHPCEGICGANAICTLFGTLPFCHCPLGLVGNPFSACVLEGLNFEAPSTKFIV